MFFLRKSHPGFTLIELLIVIGVIAVIVAFSLLSYSSYRKSIALSLATDSVQSAVRSIQQQARSGKGIDGGKPACFGLRFYKGKSIVMITGVYKNILNSGESLCSQVKESPNPISLTEQISVDIESDTDIFAIPPRGELFRLGGDPTSSVTMKLYFMNDLAKFVQVNIGIPFGAVQRK